MSAAPGWYPDPHQHGWIRYYDGTQWTAHCQAQPPVVQHVQVNHVAVVGKPKSVGLALLLSFLFGPLGMLYSTVVGGLVLFLVNLILIIPTVGFIVLLTWPAGMIWAAVAAQQSNNAVTSSQVRVQQLPVAQPAVPQQPYQPQPQPRALPPHQPTLPQLPAAPTPVEGHHTDHPM